MLERLAITGSDRIDSDTAKQLALSYLGSHSRNRRSHQIDNFEFDSYRQVVIVSGKFFGHADRPDESQLFNIYIPFERCTDGEWIIEGQTRI